MLDGMGHRAKVEGRLMSSEGKKKRGEAGQSNAKNIAFRYGGSKCDLSTRVGSTTHPRMAGAALVHAMSLGAIIPHFHPSDRLLKATDAAIDHILINHSGSSTAQIWSEAA